MKENKSGPCEEAPKPTKLRASGGVGLNSDYYIIMKFAVSRVPVPVPENFKLECRLPVPEGKMLGCRLGNSPLNSMSIDWSCCQLYCR